MDMEQKHIVFATKMPWYNEACEVEYNPEKAVKLLEDAGWKVGADDIREKNGVGQRLH